jgi:hypothetical protein
MGCLFFPENQPIPFNPVVSPFTQLANRQEPSAPKAPDQTVKIHIEKSPGCIRIAILER